MEFTLIRSSLVADSVHGFWELIADKAEISAHRTAKVKSIRDFSLYVAKNHRASLSISLLNFIVRNSPQKISNWLSLVQESFGFTSNKS